MWNPLFVTFPYKSAMTVQVTDKVGFSRLHKDRRNTGAEVNT